MSGAACEEIRADAAELALGLLDGEQRARVLEHVRGCRACRAHLDELAVVAQELLTAAPVLEPPPGFETRVLDALLPASPGTARPRRRQLADIAAGTVRRRVWRLPVTAAGTTRRRRRVPLPAIAAGTVHRRVWRLPVTAAGTRRRRRALLPAIGADTARQRLLPAVAAAALLAAVSATWVTLSTTRDERRLGASYRAVLATAGGKYLAARELRDGAGAKRGVVFAYQGDQPWVTIVLASPTGGPWRVGISTRDGAARELGAFDPATAGPVWGHALPVAVREVASVQLTGAGGRRLSARIRPR